MAKESGGKKDRRRERETFHVLVHYLPTVAAMAEARPGHSQEAGTLGLPWAAETQVPGPPSAAFKA